MSYKRCPECKESFMNGHDYHMVDKCPCCGAEFKKYEALITVRVQLKAPDLEKAKHYIEKERSYLGNINPRIVEIQEVDDWTGKIGD